MTYKIILKTQNLYILTKYVNILKYIENISVLNLPKKKKKL